MSCRHLHQWRLTADGNHQCNKYQKHNDPDDISLFKGNAYFPTQQNYLQYLEAFPQKFQVEVSTRKVCQILYSLPFRKRRVVI